jgi:hypothetical protein
MEEGLSICPIMKLTKTILAAVAAALLVPAAAQAATPGINVGGAPTADTINEAIATGAKTVRIFALWKDFEPGHRGEYPSNDVNQVNLQNTFDQAIKKLNAAGAKPLFVVTEAPSWANGSGDVNVPPANPADYGDFVRRFAAHNKTVGTVAGYEVWNEPDENTFWHPAPDATKYTAMLKAAYAGIKAGDPGATVLAGPTTGNNYEWLQNLYTAGAQGSFDAVAVHTDTACLVDGPDSFYRDNGRLARFTFLGYRSVRETMLAHGDDKPIWMSELGWSTTNGSPTSCSRGMWAGKKASGVNEAVQAQFLTKAYQCLANDPYVTEAAWFTLRDTTTESVDELNHYGVLRNDGSPKPALSAFRSVVAAGGGAGGECGDFDGPAIRVVKPAPGEQFVDKLDLSAAATDAGVGIARITFSVDGGQEIRNFTGDALASDVPVGLAPWQGSGKLALGAHTIEITAVDKNGNTTTQTVPVTKVATLPSTLTPTFKLKTKKVKCVKRSCSVSGALSRAKAAAVTPSIGGKVAVEWQFRNKQGKWRKVVGGLKPASKPFTFKAKLKQKGAWRVRFVYQGQAPWKATSSKFLTFKVK